VLVARGAAASTRRGYVQAFKDFHRFLVARKAAEIEATFGVTLDDPVDEFNAARHVGNDSPSTRPPPTPERMDEFFGFLRDRIATARKYSPAGRDYALYRTLYHCGLRSDEAASLERSDLYFDRGPFGKIHVRFGKAARGSGPRPRWVPMLDHVDLVLRWYLDDVRPAMGDSAALFCDEGGGVLHRGTIRNRLRALQGRLCRPPRYADLGAGSVAGSGFRVVDVGIITGVRGKRGACRGPGIGLGVCWWGGHGRSLLVLGSCLRAMPMSA
jgi:integrase/recombinase XerD